MLAALPAALLLSGAAPACSPYAPAQCADTNALIVQPGFQRALTAYAGPGRVAWLYQKPSPIGPQVIDVLHGPPDNPAVLGPDLVRLSACRAHSCPEKGAVFLTKAGRIQAVAVLHYSFAGTKLADGYTLSLITRDPARFTPLARSWAQDAVAADVAQYGNPGGGSTAITRVEVRAPAP